MSNGCMDRTSINKLNFFIALIVEFATRYHIGQKQAFNYLKRFQGIHFLDTHYVIMHTQSFDDVIDDLSVVCRNNGGWL